MTSSVRQNSPVGLSFGRVNAIVLRHYYLLKGSWTRILELAYWPAMQMIIWGFTTQFFISHSSWVARATGVLLAAVLLWDIVFRAQLGITVSFLEEQWSRNLANLFVTPLKATEFALGLMVMSVIRTVIGVGPAVLLAIPLYHFSIFELGLPLIPFFTCLMIMGWGIGLAVCGLILRFGAGAESFAWATVFGFAPISGIYYPVSTLPWWLQPVAWMTPAAYVFEGMRAVMYEGVFRWDLLAARSLSMPSISASASRSSSLPSVGPAATESCFSRASESQLFPLTPASAKVAMPVWQATAALSTPSASAAPDASPSRMPKSNSADLPIS